MNRKVETIYTPQEHQGFLGKGHIARPLLTRGFENTDPFILLMDDDLDKKDTIPVGGPHPHAGFETVTLVLEGELGNGDHTMRAGDFQMMTAGSGIIHTETIDKKARMRILQLWLTLPLKDRWAPPRVQDMAAKDVPGSSGDGWSIKVYSGTFAGVSSPVLNYVPMILADISLQAGVTVTQSLPSFYNAFLYIIDGDVRIDNELLKKNQVGWLDKLSATSSSDLTLSAGKSGARIILYAGEPQGDPIVSHGPFIGNSEDDIRRLYQTYRQGMMKHVSTLPKEDMLVWS
jgi:redox-sensitive bicupin YhaK (pirin superfamily)